MPRSSRRARPSTSIDSITMQFPCGRSVQGTSRFIAKFAKMHQKACERCDPSSVVVTCVDPNDEFTTLQGVRARQMAQIALAKANHVANI